MTYRDPLLDQLRNSFACPEPWDGMDGGESCRFCSRCRKEVHDFAAMTPREVRARLETGRGEVCARLTRAGGRLVLRIPGLPPRPRRAQARRRAAPLTATLLGAR